MKVLLVDDDAAILRMTARMLEQAGHTVLASSTPYGVSAQIVRHAPDVVVIDVRMPGLNGPQLAELIAQLPVSHRPVIALWSSLDEESLKKAADEAGGLPFIGKERGPMHIVSRIEALGRRDLRPAVRTA
jgi:DNA-binding response OmpR family regulator